MVDPALTAEVLERAAARIEPDGAWTRGVLARDAKGDPIIPTKPDAVCWCVAGAMMAEAGGCTSGSYDRAAWAFVDYIKGDAISRWNDRRSRTQAEAVSALRAAAARASR